ncbi:MAG: SDR family NAD(P)-dependent oxidoreductase [Nitrospinales bacterium]
MKHILVTGAGGFIGSHLTERCVESGYKVRAFVHYNSRNSWGWLDFSKYKNDIEIISGDIRDSDSVHKAMEGRDTVFHLAALVGIPYSYVSPLAYIKTNIEGTYNILQSAREMEVENVLVTSTSEVYGSSQYVPMDEQHPMVGQSPYSATKIAADQLALSFHLSFGAPIKIVRPFNAYGPRQSMRAIIPTIISQVLADKKNIRLGNLFPTRDFTFVKDVVGGFIEIAKSDALRGEVTNIGMKEEISVGDLAGFIAKLLGKEISLEPETQRLRPAGSEVKRLLCDNSKLIQKTNWKNQYNLETGLLETIEWTKCNLDHGKLDLYNV